VTSSATFDVSSLAAYHATCTGAEAEAENDSSGVTYAGGGTLSVKASYRVLTAASQWLPAELSGTAAVCAGDRPTLDCRFNATLRFRLVQTFKQQ